jgi:hypothetical protein
MSTPMPTAAAMQRQMFAVAPVPALAIGTQMDTKWQKGRGTSFAFGMVEKNFNPNQRNFLTPKRTVQ